MSLVSEEVNREIKATSGPKEVDCAIIFMLDEERDSFLEENHKFIITGHTADNFLEFSFVDKCSQLRSGVICSDGINMGNYAASVLFYKLSRRYKAHLYINVGVAGRMKDINIGDVLFVDRLSSAGENNANNVTYQLIDANSYKKFNRRNDAVKESVGHFSNGGFCFSENSKRLGKEFYDKLCKLMEEDSNLDETNVADSKPIGVSPDAENACKTGWCITFPEVIKDTQASDFKTFVDSQRCKSTVIDMEAYYLSEWHDLIKREEPAIYDEDSEFIAIKSVSDCGDKNKGKYEEAGSRKLAMNNLAEVVTCLCSEVYPFPGSSADGGLQNFIDEIISNKSIIKTVQDMISKTENRDKISELIRKFEHMFGYFIRIDDTNDVDCEDYADFNYDMVIDTLQKNQSAITIYGRSGTGKTTFLAFLYFLLKMQGGPVIYWEIPFFSEKESPTQRQITYFLSRLLQKNNNTVLLLDGIRSLCGTGAAYDELFDLLKNCQIKHLCISYGNVVDPDESIISVIDSNMKSNLELQFGGVCVDSDEFELLLDSALAFFHEVHDNNLSSGDIKKLLISSDGQPEIINVDYLLLYMIFEKASLLQKKSYRYLYTFLKAYLEAKYGNRRINQFINEIYSSLVSENENSIVNKRFEASEMFRYNPYVHNVAYATAIYDLFCKNKSGIDKEIRAFLKKKLILPSDVTMILEDKLIEAQRQQHIGKNFLDLMITVLESNIEKSLEMEAQILYTTCSLSRSDAFRGQQLKQIIIHRHNWIMQEMKNANDNERKLLMLECRTQCVVLSYFFREEDNLAWYNETLLEDDKTSTANIAFHFYYYSGRLFTFWDVASFDLKNVYDEMLYNTYYVLEKFLRTRSNDLGLSNQFVLHSFITFMQLYTHVILPSGKYQQIANKIKNACLSYEKAYKKVSPGSIKFYDKLLELIRSINLSIETH